MSIQTLVQCDGSINIFLDPRNGKSVLAGPDITVPDKPKCLFGKLHIKMYNKGIKKLKINVELKKVSFWCRCEFPCWWRSRSCLASRWSYQVSHMLESPNFSTFSHIFASLKCFMFLFLISVDCRRCHNFQYFEQHIEILRENLALKPIRIQQNDVNLTRSASGSRSASFS
jgi:hypothetical protein